MPGRDPLSQLGDLAALQANADKIIEIVSTIKEAIKSVPDIALAYKNSQGGAEIKKSTEDLIKANNDLLNSQKALDVETEKSKSLQGDVAKQIAIRREQNKQLTTEMRAEAREAAGLNDAYKKLELQYNAAQRAAKNLAATPGTPKAAIDAANSQAKTLSNQLKAIDDAVGQNHRYVGNYSAALKTLESSLSQANGRMDQLIQSGQASGEEAKALGHEISILGKLVQQQSNGFTSLSREVMATGKALETMSQSSLVGTEAFKRLEEQYVEGRRKLNEFRKDQQLLTSEAPRLAALTLAAKGLAGIYATGAGAVALFSDGNEKLEKELNKLVAVMTILQGLREIHELVEKRTAVSTIASGVAQAFKNFVMGRSTKEIEVNTEALMENVEAEESQTIATEGATEATAAQATATEAATVATEGATGAAIAFRIALLATGIGAILLLIYSAANAMSIFGKSAKQTSKEMAELAESIEKVNEAILAQSELSNESFKDQKKLLEEQLEYAEKAGKDFYTIMALKKQINDLDHAAAENNLRNITGQQDVQKAVEQTRASREKDANALSVLQRIQQDQESIHAAALKRGNAENEKDFKERQEAREKEIATAKKKYESDIKLLDDYENAEKTATSLSIETSKFSSDEQRAFAKALAVTRANAVIDANALILSNDESTQRQRIAAESSNLVQQLRIIEAEKKARLEAPGVTKVQGEEINLESSAAALKARTDTLEKIRKINDDYDKRERAAEYAIFRDAIETQAKAAEEISSNNKLSLNQRLAGYEEYELRQRQLINADANFQKQEAGKTSEELFAIEVTRQQKLIELANAGQVKQSQIVLSGLEQQQKTLEGSAKLDGLKGEVKALEELNAAYRNGTISAEAFAKKKDEIANKASQIALEQQLVMLKYIQGEYKKYGQDTQAVDLQIAETQKQLEDKKLQQDLDNAEKKKKLKQAEVALAKQTEETIASFIKGRYERGINAIQHQIDLNNKAKEVETRNIAISSLSAQQKAAEQIILDAKVAANNEELQRRQRDLKIKEAQFDREKGILDVVINTAVAITKALPDIPLSIIMGALGAAQIAAILARPVPKFASGTSSSPEGWAWTDELGPELYKTRSGKTFTGNETPTLRYLEAGTEITPFGKYDLPDSSLITYEQLKGYQRLDVRPFAEQTIEVERKMDKLSRNMERVNSTIERIGYAQIKEIRKNRPQADNNNTDAAFWAHVYNSCKY